MRFKATPARMATMARRSDPAGDAGAARVHDPRDEARRARGLRWVDPAEAPRHGRGRPRAVDVREAVREEPRACRPLVQARPADALRAARGRDAVQDGPAIRRVRGLHTPAPG